MGLLKAFFRGLVKDTADQSMSSNAENSYRAAKREPRTVEGNLRHNMEYFREILQEQFPECTFEENVSADRLGWNVANAYKTYGNVYPDRPFEFVMYKDNRLMATILLTDHNKESLAVCKNTIATSEAYHVPCVNFLMQFPNEASYIKERITKAIE